jgi:hypothetical protein
LHDAAESVHFTCGQTDEDGDGSDHVTDRDKRSSRKKGAGEILSGVVNFVAEK